MSESIGVLPWMSEPATTAVMAALETAGGKGCARFVGGCVRNAVMGIPIDDVDIATTLTPDEVTSALQRAALRAVATGVEHGTVTAISNSTPYEITTLRRDVSTDGRRAVVAFTKDWFEDAQRRDFRFNCLYADADGTVFDPTGEGVADARAGRAVFVGDAATRIREDYLRILRLFRFHAWYGKGQPDAEALAASQALKGELKTLSAERIAKELLKTLTAPDPHQAFALMAEIGVLAEVLPETQDLTRLSRLVETQRNQFWPPDAELRLAALLPDAQAASVTARRLRLSNAQHDRLVAALAPEPRVWPTMTPKEARRAVYQAGPSAFADRVKLAWAGSDTTAEANHWLALLTIGQTWRAPALPIGGEDAAAAGVPHGPLVGKALKAVETWWIDQDFPDDREAALAKLKEVARDQVPQQRP
jgi:poly(A) polymerase